MGDLEIRVDVGEKNLLKAIVPDGARVHIVKPPVKSDDATDVVKDKEDPCARALANDSLKRYQDEFSLVLHETCEQTTKRIMNLQDERDGYKREMERVIRAVVQDEESNRLRDRLHDATQNAMTETMRLRTAIARAFNIAGALGVYPDDSKMIEMMEREIDALHDARRRLRHTAKQLSHIAEEI